MANILIVDDSRSMLKLIGHVLETAGHQVVPAVGGEETLSAVEKMAVDLVITDLNMPGMSGMSLIEELRMRESTRLTPILFLTTEGSQEVRAEAKRKGATGWMKKPFDADGLLATVQRVLE